VKFVAREVVRISGVCIALHGRPTSKGKEVVSGGGIELPPDVYNGMVATLLGRRRAILLGPVHSPSPIRIVCRTIE
jgi:hypothetical protein